MMGGKCPYNFCFRGCCYIYIYISLNIIDILCLHIFFWIRSNSRITFIVFGGGGIDLCIVYSCMYPLYFLPDFGPSSGEDLLQK